MRNVFKIAITAAAMFVCLLLPAILFYAGGIILPGRLLQRSSGPFVYGGILLLMAGVGVLLRGGVQWPLGVLAAGWLTFTLLCTGAFWLTLGGSEPFTLDADHLQGLGVILGAVATLSGIAWFIGVGIGHAVGVGRKKGADSE